MGCDESRSKPSEERAIQIAEKGLGFGFNESLHVDMTIRKYSVNSTVNPSQLEKIASLMSLNINDYQNHSKITAFFNKLKDQEGIPLKDLLVIGILLSTGASSVKARLLFQVFDEQSCERLSTDRLRDEVFSSIIKHSVQLGTLVATGESPYSNELKTLKYMQDLLQIEAKAINGILGQFVRQGNAFVTEIQFVETLTVIVDGSLVLASGWRCYLNGIFIKDPPKPVFANPFSRRQTQNREPLSS